MLLKIYKANAHFKHIQQSSHDFDFVAATL
jgi:hypothetical protein